MAAVHLSHASEACSTSVLPVNYRSVHCTVSRNIRNCTWKPRESWTIFGPRQLKIDPWGSARLFWFPWPLSTELYADDALIHQQTRKIQQQKSAISYNTNDSIDRHAVKTPSLLLICGRSPGVESLVLKKPRLFKLADCYTVTPLPACQLEIKSSLMSQSTSISVFCWGKTWNGLTTSMKLCPKRHEKLACFVSWCTTSMTPWQ